MVFTKERITDSIFLSVIPSDKFKAGVIAFSLTVPLTRHGSAYNHILSGLLRRGTQSYPTMEALNRRLDELYGSYLEIKSNHVGNNLSLTFICEVLDNKYIPDDTDALAGVIDVVADILLRPLFISEDFDISLFDQEIRVILDSLNAEINNTRAYAVKRCVEIMLEDYDQYPTVDQTKGIVANATPDDIKKHYRLLLDSAPLEIFYIGATPIDDVSASVQRAFGAYSFGACHSNCTAHPIVRNSFAEASEKMSVSQGKLAMCFSTGCCISNESDDYYAALLFNEIFGGSASSRLFLNVREKMGLCYYCSSSYSTYSGIMTVSSGIEVKDLNSVKKSILEQLEQIQSGKITEDELYIAKCSIFNSYKQLYDSPFDLQAFYSGRMMFGIADTVDDCIQKLSSVELGDIVRIAQCTKLDALFFVEGTLERSENEEDENEQ